MRTALLVLLTSALPAPAADRPGVVTGRAGVVVCVSPAAAEVGVGVLKRGGTAVDAAVAVGFALAVTWPEAGNVGGGGFMLVHPARGAGGPACFDYREAAPLAATPTMFAKEVDNHSVRTSGVPGSVRGLELAHKRFGKLPWADLVAPAVKLAAGGFPVTAGLAGRLNGVLSEPRVTNPEFRRVYGKPGGGPWQAGDVLRQPDLAETLATIARGADGFYTGDLADKLDAEMTAGAGLVTKQDLAAYRAKERAPVHGTYRGFDVWGAPPPSSGGTSLLLTLNQLEKFDLAAGPRDSADTIHTLAEAMRRSFRERAEHLGDPDFTPVPPHLTTKAHAATLAPVDPAKATQSGAIAGAIKLTDGPAESDETTHYSVIDAAGTAVSTTTTLENSFGCRVVVRGAGYILNNEMTDFNPRPGVTDRAGRIGTPPNTVAGGKRMLSSMAPTILARNGTPVVVTGSPGGRTIINTVTCVVVNLVDYKMPPAAAVDAARQHHGWFPDRLSLESRPGDTAVRAKLKAMGHAVTGSKQGDAHTIVIDPATGVRTGVADLRLDGGAAAE